MILTEPDNLNLDGCYEGFGIRIKHDSLLRRTEEHDNVMPITPDEQEITWQLFSKEILKAIEFGTGEVDFLDVGTGSGIFAVLVARALQKKGVASTIIAIDKVKRMCEAAELNRRFNAVEFDVVQRDYKTYEADGRLDKNVKTIFMNPPYHIYPTDPAIIEANLPIHARGGKHGFAEFQSWLHTADSHLAETGSIFFHDMCVGDEDGPEFLKFIPQEIHGEPSIRYYNLLPRIETRTFLQEVYQRTYPEFVNETAERYPWLYYTSGVITRNGRSAVSALELPERLKLPINESDDIKKTWNARIALHRHIRESCE